MHVFAILVRVWECFDRPFKFALCSFGFFHSYPAFLIFVENVICIGSKVGCISVISRFSFVLCSGVPSFVLFRVSCIVACVCFLSGMCCSFLRVVSGF